MTTENFSSSGTGPGVPNSPTVPVSAELLYQLSITAGGLAFAVLGRMTVGGPNANARAEHFHDLSDQVEAVLTEHAPEWLERRAVQDLTGGANDG